MKYAKRGLIITALMGLALVTGCASNATAPPSAKGPTVFIKGTDLFYGGPLLEELIHEAMLLYDSASPKPTRLVITSSGGDVELGLDLGEWVREKGLRVFIPKACLSSCANYIFTAGTSVELGEAAVLFWHGSPIVDELDMPESMRIGRMQSIANHLTGKGVDPKKVDQHWDNVRLRNLQFFEDVGVNAFITIGGIFDSKQARKKGYKSYRDSGYYYSLDTIRKFGVKNLTVTGGKRWNPDRRQVPAKLIKLEFNDSAMAEMAKLFDEIVKERL